MQNIRLPVLNQTPQLQQGERVQLQPLPQNVQRNVVLREQVSIGTAPRECHDANLELVRRQMRGQQRQLFFRARAVERGNQQQDLLQDDNRQGLAKGIGEGTVTRL